MTDLNLTYVRSQFPAFAEPSLAWRGGKKRTGASADRYSPLDPRRVPGGPWPYPEGTRRAAGLFAVT